MDAAFKRAASPKSIKVLGLRLQPLTLGHLFLLVKHDCAFESGEQATIEDLMLAVFVCSHEKWKDAERGLSSWWFNLFIWIWSQTLRRVILPIEFNKFHAYFDGSHERPKDKSKSKGGDSNVPYEWRLLTLLLTDFGMSKEDALSTTIMEGNCLWATLGEAKGYVELPSDRLLGLISQARNGERFSGELN